MIIRGRDMQAASRIWVALIGFLSILSVFPHWFAIDKLADERGVQAVSLVGMANIRADIGGIFLAIGLLALIAAYRKNTTWLLATILVPASALLGRFVSLGIDGYDPGAMPPIIIEIVVLAMLGLAYRLWKKVPEGL